MAKPTNSNLVDDLYTFDVYKLYLLDKTNNVELYTETLTDSSVSFKEDLKDVRAGVGNVLLMQIPNNKSINIEISDVKTRLDWLANKQGTTVQTGALGQYNAWHLPKTYTAVAASPAKITLDYTPAVPADVRAFKVDPITGAYTELTGTITAKDMSFATGVAVGDTVWVSGFTYTTPASTLYIDFDTTKFSKVFQVVMQGIVYNGNKKPVYLKQYVFYKASLDGNMDDDLKSERDAQSIKHTLNVQLESGRTALGYVVYIPLP